MSDSIADPKLKAAKAEIEAVFAKHDIAGLCILHNAPGQSEIFINMQPSYSKLSGEMPEVRLRSKLTDYNGDQEAQRRDLEATASMVALLARGAARMALPLLELTTIIDKAIGAEHGPEEHEP